MKKVSTTMGTTKYYLRGTQIVRMENGDHDMHFFYDAQGKPAGVRYASAVYGYVYNQQGDVSGIVDKNGTSVVE